ncbi:hypothetical protein EcWSU1_04497 [Enterobacter ludwigii]|uniref:Uncharacterized protein n=1 Tax=Enterobacter ludwigii TaxID=299767 RepID=G8LLW4_9ENTR|nr:hypothetical protein EcWSU1_04497 [Enterobacter ludwigii]
MILLLLDQIFHGIRVLLYEDIHAAGVHALRVQLIFAVNIHRRNALQLKVCGGFFLLGYQRFYHKAVPCRVVFFTFHTGIHEDFTDICSRLNCLGFLDCFKHWCSDLIFHAQRDSYRPRLSQVFTQWAQELNVILGHFGAFWQLFLHVIGNMQHLLELIAMWAIEREELQNLWLASDWLFQRRILFAVGKLRSRSAKCQNHTCQRQPNFFHD